jgi:membrane protein
MRATEGAVSAKGPASSRARTVTTRPFPKALPPSAPVGARLVRSVVRVGHGLWQHDVSSAASSMAFNFFLSIIPLLVLVGFVLGHFIRKNGVDELMGPFLDTVPAASADMIRKELQRLAGTADATSVAPLSILGFLWLTASGIHHMMDVFEGVAKAAPRPWWKQRAIAFGAVLAGLLAVCATTWVILEADAQLHAHDATPTQPDHPRLFAAPPPAVETTTTHVSRGREPASAHHERKRLLARLHSTWENYVAIGVMLAVGLASLAAFYRYGVEHPAGVRRRAWPGAIIALAAWLLCSWGFGNYVISLGKYAVYYGSLAAVAVLLVWLWLTSLALLLGAEVNAQLEGVER